MTICVKGKRRYVSTGREVKPSDFNSKTQTVKGDKELNEFLKALKIRMYSIKTTLMSKDVNVSIDTVLDVFRNGEQERTMTFLQLFEIHNSNVSKRIKRKLITPTTLSKYEVTKDYLTRYIKTELKKDDILVKDITPSFIDNLFVFLLGFMSNNTAIQKMKQVKRVIRFAVDEGYIKVSPYNIVSCILLIVQFYFVIYLIKYNASNLNIAYSSLGNSNSNEYCYHLFDYPSCLVNIIISSISATHAGNSIFKHFTCSIIFTRNHYFALLVNVAILSIRVQNSSQTFSESFCFYPSTRNDYLSSLIKIPPLIIAVFDRNKTFIIIGYVDCFPCTGNNKLSSHINKPPLLVCILDS